MIEEKMLLTTTPMSDESPTDELIARMTTDAARVGLHFVGINLDSNDALLALAEVRDEAHAALLEFMPPDVAAFVADVFMVTVRNYASEINAQKRTIQ